MIWSIKVQALVIQCSTVHPIISTHFCDFITLHWKGKCNTLILELGGRDYRIALKDKCNI